MRAPVILIVLPLLLIAAARPGHDLSSRAKANLAALVSAADYPDAAIRAGVQGRVAFALDVSAEGRVTACAIETSSGSPLLDETTCSIMIYRAQFAPARDRRGQPATDRIRSAVRWVLPKAEEATGLASRAKANLAALVSDADYPDEAIRAGAQGTVRFALEVAADGHVTGCTVEMSSGSPVLDQATCQIMTARAQFTPAHDSRDQPTADTVRAAIRWVLPQPEEPADNEADPPDPPSP
ncbi:MAG TPA: energy transducer TonB [Allosphingosinicella sp.]|jgi:TonB family protein|nr:energy transducer TonB [Allosphingosinicella sp.]